MRYHRQARNVDTIFLAWVVPPPGQYRAIIEDIPQASSPDGVPLGKATVFYFQTIEPFTGWLDGHRRDPVMVVVLAKE